MMVIEVHLDPRGDKTCRRTVECIALGNISGPTLTDISDYAVYESLDDVGKKPPTDIVRGHQRSLGALLLAERALRAVNDYRLRAN